MQKQLVAEGLGTFWLVFSGCSSAIFAAAFPGLSIGFAGVALAFGLTVLTMVYAVAWISGAFQSGGRSRAGFLPPMSCLISWRSSWGPFLQPLRST